jgi:TRAP-type C4-dicarboxylate transport system substrate-binding protein
MLRSVKTTLAAACVAAVAGAAAVPAGAQKTWDMPTPYSDTTFHTVNIRQFAEDVARATNGQLRIQIHSAGSLIRHPEIRNAVRGQQVPIGEVFMSLLVNDNAVFGIDAQPFLATDYDAARRLWDAQRPVVAEVMQRQGLRPLFAVPWPPQGLYTKREINRIEDMRGLKFRSNSAVLDRFAQIAGAAPTQVEAPDIPQAFATGAVEAMITSSSTGVDSKAWDYLTHYYDIQAWLPKNIVFVNERAFRRLTEAQQTAVVQAAEAAERRGWEMSRQETETRTRQLRENGIRVSAPSPELVAGLRRVGEQMIAEWRQAAGAEGATVLQAYGR